MRAARSRLALLAALAASPVAAAPAPAALSFYAAASLRDALEAAQPALERAVGVRLAFNFGASSDLARQIEAANRADLFFSADQAWMDHLDAAGLVDRASRRTLLSNRLVVVAPLDSALAVATAADLAGPAVGRLSLAQPEAVPAGRYARAWLESKGLWVTLRGRVVPALDARAALAAVASGGVDAGIVYATDAALEPRVRVVHVVPAAEGPPIAYVLAALGDRPRLERARAVAAWLAGPEAAATFARFGFVVPAGAR